MGVYKLSGAGGLLTPRVNYTSMLAGNEAYAESGYYELIETTILGSATSSVTFSSLDTYASRYKHLQIRYTARGDDANPGGGIYSQLNSDSGSNYNAHYLVGNGSSVSSSTIGLSVQALTGIFTATTTAGSFAGGVMDLLDCYSTTKNKTFRILSGSTGTGQNRIDLHSGLWLNTSSVTTWLLKPGTGNFIAGSRFSLYGIKG